LYSGFDDIPPNVQSQIEDDEMKLVMEMSLNEMIEGLNKNLPSEPGSDSPNAVNLVIKHNDKTFTRRFNKSDKIQHIKDFVTTKARTFATIEISEAYPKKIFSDENSTISESGISNNTVLIATIK